MGLRFRKSIKVAPGVKLNLNKKSVGVTVGGKGAHYTMNSSGKKTASVGIPGTGISYSKTSSSKTTKTSRKTAHTSPTKNTTSLEPKKKKGKGCLTSFVILFLLAGIGSCMSGNNAPEKLLLSAYDQMYDINESIPIELDIEPSDADINDIECKSSGGEFTYNDGKLSFIASKDGVYKLTVVCGDIKSNTIKVTVEDKKAIAEKKEAEAKKKAEEEAQKKAEEEARLKAEQDAKQKAEEEAKAQAAESQQPQEEMVWVPSSGSKYHSRSSCSGMKNPSEVTLSKAESMGYTPCKRCH